MVWLDRRSGGPRGVKLMWRALVWFSFVVPAAAQAAPATFHDLTIVYSSDRRGEVAPCHCDSAPLGGVDRQAGYVEALRKEVSSLLVLDGGDNFFPEPSATELARYLPRAELIADAFAILKPAAVVPGERDLAAGVSLWKTLGARARVTWVISNLAPTSGKPFISMPHHLAELNGQRVLVLGFVSPQSLPEALRKDGYKIEEVVPAAQRLVNQYKDVVDLVVIIAHTGGQTEENIAEKIGHPALVLSAHEGRLQFGARSVSSSQIVSANHSGKYMVRLDLHYQSRRPLVAGNQVQKFIRDRIATSKQMATLDNTITLEPSSSPTITKERAQTKLELTERRAKQDADSLWAEQSTLFFQLVPMDRHTQSIADLRQRAEKLDPAGYEIDAVLQRGGQQGK